MDVVIAGAHGKVGLRLGRLLAERGDRVRGLIRNPGHERELRDAGLDPVVCDLEDGACDPVAAIEGADAVVFAAGAGSGSGADRKWTVDYAGAAKLIVAARAQGVRRYVIVSAMGAASPPAGDEGFAVYLRAKARADEELQRSGLDWTVVRPGRLTDDVGTGQVHTAERLQRGDRVRGLIRNPGHERELRDAGLDPVVCDLEDGACDPVAAIEGADAVVFAAGAGSGSGADRKWTVDYAGAAKLIVAARAQGVRRYVIVSAMGAASPPAGDEGFAVYLRAKARADEELQRSGLDWTVVRPGRLTDDVGTGQVHTAERLQRGDISRDDVAATLLAVLDEPATIGTTFDLVAGDVPIRDAVAAAGRGG
ncbi:MAG: SDR family oxidoreductase [Actinobacteria bacterium]|nr:MAG: SDR family oxidoreductase [Actinomycetota bacterium]